METSPVSDAATIEKAVRGDTQAFRFLADKYQHFAFRLAMRFVGSRVEAEDIVQEAFVRVWKSLETYNRDLKFSTWLYRIVVNRCLDFLKSGKRKREQITDGWDDHQQLSDSSTRNFEDSEFVSVVRQMAEMLTPKQRAVFVLRDLEELSVKEVCAILSMSSGKVKSNLYYARIKMGQLVKMYYKESIVRES